MGCPKHLPRDGECVFLVSTCSASTSIVVWSLMITTWGWKDYTVYIPWDTFMALFDGTSWHRIRRLTWTDFNMPDLLFFHFLLIKSVLHHDYVLQYCNTLIWHKAIKCKPNQHQSCPAVQVPIEKLVFPRNCVISSGVRSSTRPLYHYWRPCLWQKLLWIHYITSLLIFHYVKIKILCCKSYGSGWIPIVSGTEALGAAHVGPAPPSCAALCHDAAVRSTTTEYSFVIIYILQSTPNTPSYKPTFAWCFFKHFIMATVCSWYTATLLPHAQPR